MTSKRDCGIALTREKARGGRLQERAACPSLFRVFSRGERARPCLGSRWRPQTGTTTATRTTLSAMTVTCPSIARANSCGTLATHTGTAAVSTSIESCSVGGILTRRSCVRTACDQTFGSMEARRRHWANASAHRGQFCNLCDCLIPAYEDMATHESERHWPCQGCDLIFATEGGHNRHGQQDHPWCHTHKRAFRSQANYEAVSTTAGARISRW